MQLRGEWYECDDHVLRPTIRAEVHWADGVAYDVRFLVDTAADCTALSAELVPGLPAAQPPPPHLTLSGIGGRAAFGVVSCTLAFPRPGAVPITIRGQLAVFAEPGAIDMCVLGRDVMSYFDLIVSWRHDTVLLVGGNDRFAVARPQPTA